MLLIRTFIISIICLIGFFFVTICQFEFECIKNTGYVTWLRRIYSSNTYNCPVAQKKNRYTDLNEYTYAAKPIYTHLTFTAYITSTSHSLTQYYILRLTKQISIIVVIIQYTNHLLSFSATPANRPTIPYL